MSITSEIQRIQGNISDAYNSCAVKGATMPVVQNSAYLADTINSITGGGGGTEGYDLGVGTYWVDNGVAKSPQAGDVSKAFQMITSIVDNGMHAACRNLNITGSVNFANLTNIGNYGLSHAFGGTKINNVYFPNLIHLNNYNSMEFVFHSSLVSFVNMCNLTNVGYAGLRLAFSNCQNLLGFNLSSLKGSDAYGGLEEIFSNCKSLTEVHLNSYIGNYETYRMFYNCTNLTTIDFPAFTTAKGNDFNMAFGNCTSLINVNFDNLVSLPVRGAFRTAFVNCSSLTNIKFPSLNFINVSSFFNCFWHCNNLSHIYFNSLNDSSFGGRTNQFSEMLRGVNDCTVHFPASIQSTISSWSDVTSGFNGTNTTVLFDL